MIYRKITAADVPQLAKIYAETFNSAPWFDKWTEKTAAKRLADIISCTGFFGIAAEDDGKIISAALGGEEQYFDGVMFNLKEFFTENRRRGKGIGTALLKELDKSLREKGIREITLFTAVEDEEFYSSRGFKKAEGMIMMNREL